MTQKPLTASNSPSQYSGGITLKSKDELNLMTEAGFIVGTVLGYLKLHAEVGMTTEELDNMAENKIRLMGGLPVFKGYMGFPSSICASINEEIVHGIPGNRTIKDGDILTIDCGASVGGYIGDAAITFQLGKSTKIARDLIKVTNESLNIGINQVKVGGYIGDIGYAISSFAEKKDYGIVRNYVGHGVGKHLHEDPQIPNYGIRSTGPELKEGMVIAIEPMLTEGKPETKILKDNWTVVTKDNSLSAHFEHTVSITNNGPVILTKIPELIESIK